MKFLIAVPLAEVKDDKWTTVPQPVVPCFPSQHTAAFLTVPGLRLADRAEVGDTDADPDALVESLAKEYPGLPRKLHENYVMAVFKAVYEVEPGTVFRVRISQQQAILVNDKTGGTTVLWDKQPLESQ